MEKAHRIRFRLRYFTAALLTGGLVTFTANAGTEPFYSATPGAPGDAQRAIRICETIESTPPSRQETHLAAGISLAERAIARFPDEPRAHFALFCTLGRQIEHRGTPMRSVFDVRRVRGAVEKALALEPNYIDAMVAHGALLGRLPWLLGGDPETGEALIRRAIRLDPGFLPARRELAEMLRSQGRLDEAFRIDVAHLAD